MTSSSLKHLLIGGLLLMGISTGANARDLVVVNPPSLGDPAPKGYSTAVIIPAGKRIAFAYVNLGLALEAIGARPSQVVKLNVFVVDHDMTKLAVLTEGVIRMFGATLPAQTLISVPKLAIDPMLFEVEAVVALD